MLDEFSIADHDYVGVIFANLGNIVKSLVHFRQMSSVVSFLLEIPFLFFVETKDYEDVWFSKCVLVQMRNLMIWNNFDLSLVINGMSSVL